MWSAEDLAKFMFETYEALSKLHQHSGERLRWDDLDDVERGLRVAVSGQTLDAMRADGLLDSVVPSFVNVSMDQSDIEELADRIVAAIGRV